MITRGGCFTRTILCLRFFDFVVLFLRSSSFPFPGFLSSRARPEKKKREKRKEGGAGGLLTRVLRKERITTKRKKKKGKTPPINKL